MIAGGHRENDDPVEVFLDDLLGNLRGTTRDVRRTLAECEAHLRESVERRVEAGTDPKVAAAQAVQAFGNAQEIATRFNRAHRPAAVRALLPAALLQTWRLTAVGLIAIGISGVIAWAVAAIAGTSAVFGDVPGTHYSASTCAHFLAVQPTAKTCTAAALLEGRDDALLQRWAMGVLGVLLLAAWLWFRRRTRPSGPDLRTPAALIGVVSFGAAGVFLTGYGIDRAVINTGSGQWISAGAVALAAALAYAVVLWRQITSVPELVSR